VRAPTERNGGGPGPALAERGPEPRALRGLHLWRVLLRTGWESWKSRDPTPRRPRSALERIRHLRAPDLEAPVFVVGAARSGTTFVGECLGALPELSYHFEPAATKAAARYVAEGRWSRGRAERFYRCVYGWLMRLRLEADLRFAEKTPRNAFLIGFLGEAFPGARFVHVIRDGRDAALSHRAQPWLREDAAGSGRFEPGGYPMGPWPQFWVEAERAREFAVTSDLHRCIWAWRRFTEAALAGGAALGEGRYLEIRYEQWVAEPRRESARLLDFLDVREPASRARLAERAGRARRDTVGRWRASFGPEERAVVEREAGALLRRLGYA
jgi:hypothetical protein